MNLRLHEDHMQSPDSPGVCDYELKPISVATATEMMTPDRDRSDHNMDRQWSTEEDRSVGVVLNVSTMTMVDGIFGLQLHTVDLLFAEVDYGFDRKTGRPMIAITPARGGGPDVPRTWLVVNCDDDRVPTQHILTVLGSAGVIRWDRFAKYTTDGLIASGSTAQVYRAAKRGSSPKSIPSAADARTDADGLVLKVMKAGLDIECFRKEAKMLAAAQYHPNIIQFHGLVCPESNEIALILDRCSSDLFAVIERKVFHERGARDSISQVLSALDHLHGKGIVHRDVKPENILVGQDGRMVLGDLGLAAFVDDNGRMSATCGSPGYLAPEVANKMGYNHKVDSFGAGAVLYFMLVGHPPFHGSSLTSILRKTVRKEVDFDRRAFEKTGQGCLDCIWWLLRKDPIQRPSASEAMQYPWISGKEEGAERESPRHSEHAIHLPKFTPREPTEPRAPREPRTSVGAPRRFRRQPRQVSESPRSKVSESPRNYFKPREEYYDTFDNSPTNVDESPTNVDGQRLNPSKFASMAERSTCSGTPRTTYERPSFRRTPKGGFPDVSPTERLTWDSCNDSERPSERQTVDFGIAHWNEQTRVS
jgi:serine/threonine protein kinase